MNKRIIYTPELKEVVPDGAVYYSLPGGVHAIDVIVDENFSTRGTIHFSSVIIQEATKDKDGNIISPAVHEKELDSTFIHHFAGWEDK